MFSQQPPKKPPLPDALDFELTDFEDAKRSLEELPPGVDQAQSLFKGWESLRRKPLPTDRALTGVAMDWVVGLPPALRPHATCERYPRVANAVAESWNDLVHSLSVLEHLLQDHRGGRRGFPVPVQQELQALYDHQRQRAGR
jgi:hypothetical protein